MDECIFTPRLQTCRNHLLTLGTKASLRSCSKTTQRLAACAAQMQPPTAILCQQCAARGRHFALALNALLPLTAGTQPLRMYNKTAKNCRHPSVHAIPPIPSLLRPFQAHLLQLVPARYTSRLSPRAGHAPGSLYLSMQQVLCLVVRLFVCTCPWTTPCDRAPHHLHDGTTGPLHAWESHTLIQKPSVHQ